MKKLGSLIFLLLLAMIGANILHSTESELVSIKAFVRNQKGKISEIKNFKKSKSLKVDGVKQQLSHFLIVLNEFTGSSLETFTIKVSDQDTIYYEKDISLSAGGSEEIYLNDMGQSIADKKLKLYVHGIEEFEANITLQKTNNVLINGSIEYLENIDVKYHTSFNYSKFYDPIMHNVDNQDKSIMNSKGQSLDIIEISGKINDIEIVGIEKGMEVYRKGPFCLSGTINIKLYNPEVDQNQQQDLNKTSDKKDLVNLIIKQKNKVIYNGYSYFKE